MPIQAKEAGDERLPLLIHVLHIPPTWVWVHRMRTPCPPEGGLCICRRSSQERSKRAGHPAGAGPGQRPISVNLRLAMLVRLQYAGRV
jgi:hypothetical protein